MVGRLHRPLVSLVLVVVWVWTGPCRQRKRCAWGLLPLQDFLCFQWQ